MKDDRYYTVDMNIRYRKRQLNCDNVLEYTLLSESDINELSIDEKEELHRDGYLYSGRDVTIGDENTIIIDIAFKETRLDRSHTPYYSFRDSLLLEIKKEKLKEFLK